MNVDVMQCHRDSVNQPMMPAACGNAEDGAGDEIRTHDIHLGKVALYH